MKKFLLIVSMVGLLRADGSIWPPQGDYEIYSSSQVAVMKKIPGGEELSILVKAVWSFDYNGFAWIVPVPSEPQIEEVDEQLFTDLAYMSAPVYAGGGCSPFARGDYYDIEMRLGDDYLDIVSYHTIGFLDAVVLHTNHADSLINWLAGNGYSILDNAHDMLSDYIERDWQYFFCARFDTTLIETYYQNVGVKITFATNNLVYPMKISALSSQVDVQVFLYVIDQYKMFCDRAELKYANRVTSEELDHISQDLPVLGNYLSAEDYLTKLQITYDEPADMASDIYLYRSPDNTEYQEFWDLYHGSLAFGNSYLLPLFLYGLYFGIKKMRRRKK